METQKHGWTRQQLFALQEHKKYHSFPRRAQYPFLDLLSVYKMKITCFVSTTVCCHYLLPSANEYVPHLGSSGFPFINNITGAEFINFFNLEFKSYDKKTKKVG